MTRLGLAVAVPSLHPGSGEVVMNLKQAALRLGVHYQTAYKLVRSGRLAAVRVGGVYDVSESALARYQADAVAATAAPVPIEAETRPDERARRAGRGGAHPRAAVARAGAEVTTCAAGVVAVVADALAHHVGDLCVVETRGPLAGVPDVSYSHADPARRSLAAGMLASAAVPWRGLAALREPTLVPHVPQGAIRERVPPPLRQHLERLGLHSLAAAPLAHDNAHFGAVTLTRDEPGCPYDRDDLVTVVEVANLLGAALGRAARGAVAAHRRTELLERVGPVARGRGALGPQPVGLLAEGTGLAEAVADPEGVVEWANREAHKIGWSRGARVSGVGGAHLGAGDLERIRRDLEFRDAASPSDPGVLVHAAPVRTPGGACLAIVAVAHRVPAFGTVSGARAAS
jgi:excisionase family DNA binding protein